MKSFAPWRMISYSNSDHDVQFSNFDTFNNILLDKSYSKSTNEYDSNFQSNDSF